MLVPDIDETVAVMQDTTIKTAYQRDMKIPMDSMYEGSVMTGGKTAIFYNMGSATTSKRNQDAFDPTNAKRITTSSVEVMLEQFKATAIHDPHTLTQTSFSAESPIAYNLASAIARRCDQVRINALGAGSFGNTVATDVGGANSNLNIEKLLALKEYFDANHVPDEDRFLLVHTNQINRGLLEEAKLQSIDTNDVRALVEGKVDTYLGFKIIRVGNFESDGDVTGLPKTGSVRTCYAWHKRSVGLVTGMDIPLTIDRLPERDQNIQWYKDVSLASVKIDTVGVQSVLCTEAA